MTAGAGRWGGSNFPRERSCKPAHTCSISLRGPGEKKGRRRSQLESSRPEGTKGRGKEGVPIYGKKGRQDARRSSRSRGEKEKHPEGEGRGERQIVGGLFPHSIRGGKEKGAIAFGHVVQKGRKGVSTRRKLGSHYARRKGGVGRYLITRKVEPRQAVKERSSASPIEILSLNTREYFGKKEEFLLHLVERFSLQPCPLKGANKLTQYGEISFSKEKESDKRC